MSVACWYAKWCGDGWRATHPFLASSLVFPTHRDCDLYCSLRNKRNG